jgi:CheY-like chemotaxis protein/HAMP domain-containing protein/signal transduction histidine kinase
MEPQTATPTPSGNDILNVKQLLEILTAVKKGDFRARMPIEQTGIAGKIGDALNDIIELNERMANEFARVSATVGKDGKTSQRVTPGHLTGGWLACVDSINTLITDLVHPTDETARVIGAVAKGDLSQNMALEADGRPLKGEFLRTARVVNGMVEQLGSFASEVTRVAREVGTEGKLGGQATVKGVAGTWKDLTDSVNSMASNLTAQVRNIAEVTTAVASGDLSKKITVDVRGEILQLKDTMNTMVDQLRTFSLEVTRVAREVGTEGKLGGQAVVVRVAGTWKDLTDSVNSMASNLTSQVRNIAEVTTAVARGDLNRKITVDVKGEILELKNTINTMVDQLRAFSSEVTRVAREVGTEGKLGGQAVVPGVGGTWKDLTDSVNLMASNLTGQVRAIAEVTTAVAKGDLGKKITVDVKGEILELKNTINTMVDQLNGFASEVTRVAREVGTEGKLGGQANVKGVAGTWKDLTDSVNLMASNLTAQVRNIAEVTTAVANGDLSKKITVDVEGEILALKRTINTMVGQLSSFASEVTRVAREVGTEGKLGGQAVVRGVGGTWKDLTDSVNSMASNLTAQVRNIADVTTAVARGELDRKITVDVRGEILELKNTINTMVDQLNAFAGEVTRVAREVGTEGQLGGQADVPGAAGIWRDLTDNVNQLAGNLTAQVRAIAEVSTAVTQGDLTRSITVQAAGEVASLKDNINQMIRNLQATTRKNTDQDWLKTNVARFTRMLQGQRDLMAVSRSLLSEVAPLVQAQHGAFYLAENDNSPGGAPTTFRLIAGYAFRERTGMASKFRPGEGLVGQCALDKERILVDNVPADYVQINSGLGEATPQTIVVLPVLFEGEVKAVIELASFVRFSDVNLAFLDQLTEGVGIVLNSIAATMRTEQLLQQSQALTEELQSQQQELTETNKRLEIQARTLQLSEERLKQQQEELQQANEELEERAEMLAQQKAEVEGKNREVERARMLLQEKAEQLALTSRYKSQFLANMSHELRTPLNSLLILSRMLAENADKNLSAKQVEHAETIHASGSDLLELINDILDLSKIESGTVNVDVEEVELADVRAFVERTFRQVAVTRNLAFDIEQLPELPAAIRTDARRLQQVLKNLLSNAFKFTEQGGVTLRIALASQGWTSSNQTLNEAQAVVAFAIRDTGVGIHPDKHRVIFEAFQQADGSTSRKYGGTGLGLSISREISRMLGGEIALSSAPGMGSTFTLYLPVNQPAPARATNGESLDRAHAMQALADSLPPSLDGHGVEQIDESRAIEQENEGTVEDDRGSIEATDRVLLIIEDDPIFAQMVLERAHERGFRGLIARTAQGAIKLVHGFRVDAITLDLRLPDRDGWTVLDRLKHDPRTRHIPVHIISAQDEQQRGLRLGALSYLQKPVSKEALDAALSEIKQFVERPVKNLLVVEDNEGQRKAIVELIGNHDVRTTAVGTGKQALAALREQPYDCAVIDLGLPDMTGFHLIEKIKTRAGQPELPIIVYTGRALSRREETELRRVAEAIVVKDVSSPERLFDETTLFLHRVEASLPADKRRLLAEVQRVDEMLVGRKVLIVDDDVRNIFALSALLERRGLMPLTAESGAEAIALLKRTPDIAAVLMDVMMPDMDGYDTMRAIRRVAKFKKLPIIALTAKAMKGDRDKCIEAGASDYIAKPVDVDQLFSLLRVWLYE